MRCFYQQNLGGEMGSFKQYIPYVADNGVLVP